MDGASFIVGSESSEAQLKLMPSLGPVGRKRRRLDSLPDGWQELLSAVEYWFPDEAAKAGHGQRRLGALG
jgi:hypothetical protein